MHIVIIA